MCFVKTKMPKIDTTETVSEQQIVNRKEADASLTKRQNEKPVLQDNIKTSPYGLEELAKTEKKTLLGE